MGLGLQGSILIGNEDQFDNAHSPSAGTGRVRFGKSPP